MGGKRAVGYKQVRVRQLRAFCACVRERSYTAAARAVGTSQPAVWEQVRGLERRLGATLLLRRGRELVPTENGLALLDLAAGVVAGMDSLEERFAERRAGVVRGLALAAATSLAVEELADAVAAFAAGRPAVCPAVLAVPNDRVLELVAAGEADLGVVQFGRMDAPSPLLTTELLYHRPWSLVAPAGHPLLRRRKLALADLAGPPLVLEGAGLPWRRLVDEAFRAAGLLERVRVAAEVNNALAARRLVGLGLGLTVLPRPAAGLDVPGTATRPLGDLFPPENVVGLWRRGATPRPVAREFADFVRRRFGPAG